MAERSWVSLPVCPAPTVWALRRISTLYWGRSLPRPLYARSGITTSLTFNTLYQLYRRKREGDPALEVADTMLLTPDLLGYFPQVEYWQPNHTPAWQQAYETLLTFL